MSIFIVSSDSLSLRDQAKFIGGMGPMQMEIVA